MPAHKHCVLIMEYAKLAQEHECPEECFQYRCVVDGNRLTKWMDCQFGDMHWEEEFEYRLKQRTITLPDGTVLPEPVREPLDDKQKYYSPCHFGLHELAGVVMFECKWKNTKLDNVYLSNGLIHLTETNARAWWTYFTRLAKCK